MNLGLIEDLKGKLFVLHSEGFSCEMDSENILSNQNKVNKAAMFFIVMYKLGKPLA